MTFEREIMINNCEDETHIEERSFEKQQKIDIPVNSYRVKAQALLDYIYNLEDEEARQELYELMNMFSSQKQYSGDAGDFHNFAVELARNDEYALACKVLECALSFFPKNVDLLADYLQFGVKCNRFDECKHIYKTLMKIPRRRWTWRGFAFVVDYLEFLIDRTDSDKVINSKEKEMLSVVRDFREYSPYSEESYRTESEVYRILNLPDKELEVLRMALKNVKVAPKCALRYADILFERGMYEEAAMAIKRAIRDATQTQSSVNEGYLYYLSALCKIALAQKSSIELELEEKAVNEIYSDFNIALLKFSNTKNNFIDVIRTKTNTIINKTNIEIDPKYELLWNECSAN